MLKAESGRGEKIQALLRIEMEKRDGGRDETCTSAFGPDMIAIFCDRQAEV